MASQSFSKEKIVEIVEPLSQYEYEQVYYQFVNFEIAIDLRFC